MIILRAATAYKEFAHIPSIAEKLKKYKYINDLSAKKAAKSLFKTHHIETTKLPNIGMTYFPTEKEIKSINKKLGDNRIINPIYLQGKININRKQVKQMAGGKVHPSIYRDAETHEALEKVYGSKILAQKNNTALWDGHNNSGVLVQEARVYNQTGGDITRGGGYLKNIRHLREDVNDGTDISEFVAEHKDTRIKSKDWKQLIKKLSNKTVIKTYARDRIKREKIHTN